MGLTALIALLFFGLLGTAPETAEAQGYGSYRSNRVRFDGHVTTFRHHLALGGRVDIQLLPEGLAARVDDELVLSPGVEIAFWHEHHASVWPLITTQWNFYLPRDWSIHPELGISVELGHGVHPHLFLGFGARWHFDSFLALLLRISWPGGLQVGLAW